MSLLIHGKARSSFSMIKSTFAEDVSPSASLSTISLPISRVLRKSAMERKCIPRRELGKTQSTVSSSLLRRYPEDMDPFRLKKVEDLRAHGLQPYAAKFERTHTLIEGGKAHDDTAIRVAGRVVLFRDMGKLTFATLQDHTGRLQISFREEIMGAEEYKRMIKLIDLGDFIGVSGERFTTKKGEPTVSVKEWTMLSKALRQPPEKWHGIGSQETAWRQRYLDLLSNRETFDRFLFRSAFLKRLREFYWAHGFVEVETPVLTNAASGALATPFRTHHEAYGMDVFLRIAAGETFQKECLVGGFDRTFEIARCFRNEGLDPSHLQDFTMEEHYSAYWDFEENMEFTEEMLSTILKELMGSTI